MATPVLQSSNNANTGAASVNVTKPTGLAVGDLLLAIAGGTADSGSPIFNTPTNWTKAADNSNNSVTSAVLWKIADSSDVAASNFTFSHSGGGGSTGISVYLARITGHHSSSPVAGAQCTNDTTVFNVTPGTSDALLFLAGVLKSSGGSGWSGYTISGTNPSWTEVLDNPGSLYMGVAYATANSASAITSADVLESGANNRQRALVAISEQVNITQTPSMISLIGNLIAPAVATFASVSVAVQSLVASVIAPTVTTTTATVTNQSKNAAANIVNVDKS